MKKTSVLGILSGVALASLATTGAAQALTLVPPGLNPGAQYRLVFVTSTTRDATSINIDDYNAFVNTTANAVPAIAALDTTWTAIGSTAAVAALNNTNTNPNSGAGVPIYRLDGLKVAESNSDLWDTSIQNAISVNEKSETTDVKVWAGTDITGYASNQQLGSKAVSVGSSSELTRWILYRGAEGSGGPFPPGESKSLYGISSNLTVPEGPVEIPPKTPEPSSLLGYITLGGLMLGSAARKARK